MRKYVHSKVRYLHFSLLGIYEGSLHVLKNKMTNSLQILEPCFFSRVDNSFTGGRDRFI